MTPTAIAILVLSLTTAGGLGWGALERRGRTADRKAASAALAECEAREVPEAVGAAAQGTTDALDAAMAPELAEVEARVELVRALPRAEVTRALLDVASPQLLAAESARLGCEAMGATGDSARMGCGPQGVVLARWSAAVEAQAACPDPDLNVTVPMLEEPGLSATPPRP